LFGDNAEKMRNEYIESCQEHWWLLLVGLS
jgi:hypothetical protein